MIIPVIITASAFLMAFHVYTILRIRVEKRESAPGAELSMISYLLIVFLVGMDVGAYILFLFFYPVAQIAVHLY